MKLTNTQNMKASKSGMTLLELTVVILVLLSLISILFIGARAWKKGSDRAASILQIRNVQQAVRSHSNMSGLNPADTFTQGDVFGPEKFIEKDPVNDPLAKHPAGSTYGYTYAAEGVVPAIGILYMETTVGTDAADFNPTEHGDW